VVWIAGLVELGLERPDGRLLGVAEASGRPLQVEEIRADGAPGVAVSEQVEAVGDIGADQPFLLGA
jgi:hypothetical protein